MTVALAMALALSGTFPASEEAAADVSGGVVGYVEGGNVFLHTADGRSRRKITTNGTNQNPYLLAGIADNGMLVASYGPSNSKAWYFFNPDGSMRKEGPNLVPMNQCGGALGSIGPISPRLHPQGGLLSYYYFCNYFSGGTDIRLTVDIPQVYTAPGNTADITSGLSDATWFGKRLIASDGTGIFVQENHADVPFRMGFDGWLSPSDPSVSLNRVEVARAGNRFLLEASKGTETWTEIYSYTGTPPAGDFEFVCKLGASGSTEDATFSPDGTRIAWRDSGGVKVGTVNMASGGNCLVSGSVKVLSATGNNPRFSSYTLDTTPPDTKIVKGPPKKTTARKATFRFTSTEQGSTFECKLDGKAWSKCSSPKTYKGLKKGAHTFRVRATDKAGNTDPTPAKRAWRVI